MKNIMLLASTALFTITLHGRTETKDLLKTAESFDTTHIFTRFKSEIENKFGIADENTAIKLKNEGLRFLVMCAAHPDKNIEMYSEEIDEFWHTFMLFSHDYFDFCNQLGVPYIHHSPNIDEEDSAPHSSFNEFSELYQQTFNESLPKIWNYSNKNQLTRCSSHCRNGGGGGNCRGQCRR